MALQILCAQYATPNANVDVTLICQKAVSTGNDDIPVNNQFMGGDPDIGVVKQFGILYFLNGTLTAQTAQEGQTVDLVPAPAAAKSA
ncbi:MAG TPA: hypothetical protein VF297_10810 [Pyrinomonadaceae bacterium]